MTRRDDPDDQATSGRAVRRKNERARQAARVLARARWLNALPVFWTGVAEHSPPLPGSMLPLRAALEARLVDLPAGLYAVWVDLPADGRLPLQVTAVHGVTPELLGSTARAIEAIARYPKVAPRLLGDVDCWRRTALACLDAYRRAAEGAKAWRAAATAALALEARAIWLGAGLRPSEMLPPSTLAAVAADAANDDPLAVRLAAVAIGARRLGIPCPAPWSAWAAAGRSLDRWPAATIARLAAVLGVETLEQLATAMPALNDDLAAMWAEERATEVAPATPLEMTGLVRLLCVATAVRTDPGGPLACIIIANRLRRKGAPGACAAIAGWLETCGPLLQPCEFWRDALAFVESGAARLDAKGARSLVSSLERHGPAIAAELARDSNDQAGEMRQLLPAVLARGPEATGRVLQWQLWLRDRKALDAALRWIEDAEQRARAQERQSGIPLPRALFDIDDPALRDTLADIGLRAWDRIGDVSAVEQLLAILAREVSRLDSASHWIASRSDLAAIVAPLMRRVSQRTAAATGMVGTETARLVHVILEVCARWRRAGFGELPRLARILADRWLSLEDANTAWDRDDDERADLLIRLAEGRIPRLLALLEHPPAPRKYVWRAADGWMLVVAHPMAHGWVSACLDRTELITRVVRLLERIALVARLEPGLTPARFFRPLGHVPPRHAWPSWVSPDARAMLNQIALARAVAGADGMPGAVRRGLDRAATTQFARLLPKQVALAGLTALESLARRELEQRWRDVLGGDCPSIDGAAWDNALHMLLTVDHNRRMLVRLLRGAARRDHTWMRDLAPNRAFLAGLAAAGLDPREWLAERTLPIAGPSGALRAIATTDPLEVLQMGSLFGTCLSAGRFNAHAAVAAAVEVNKRVLYAKDDAGRVLGRQLLALTPAGEMIAFTCYGAGADDPGQRGQFVKLVLELLALDIARSSRASLMTAARISSGLSDADERALTLFCRGYVDSPEPFDWWLEALWAADRHSAARDRERLRLLLEQPVPPELDARSGPDWRRDELARAARRALMWLGADAPPLSEEQAEGLGLIARQR